MKLRRGDGEVKSVVQAEEDGAIKTIWPHLQACCEEYFAQELAKIGEEMKKP